MLLAAFLSLAHCTWRLRHLSMLLRFRPWTPGGMRGLRWCKWFQVIHSSPGRADNLFLVPVRFAWMFQGNPTVQCIQWGHPKPRQPVLCPSWSWKNHFLFLGYFLPICKTRQLDKPISKNQPCESAQALLRELEAVCVSAKQAELDLFPQGLTFGVVCSLLQR